MEFTESIQTGLIFGGVLSVMMTVMLFVIGLVNPEIMLNDYPPDIRAKYGKISERAQRQKQVFAAVLVLLLFVTIVVSIAQLTREIGADPTFGEIFAMLFIMFMVFNLVDLVIIDWLLVVTIQPKFVILPETAGMAGYKDYVFHFRGFLIGIVICLIASLIIAGIASLVFAF